MSHHKHRTNDPHSCLRCLKQGHSCDGNRPCLNCLTLGLADDCADLKAQSTSTNGNYGSTKSKRNANLPIAEVEIKTFDPDGFVTIKTDLTEQFDFNTSAKPEMNKKSPVKKAASPQKKAVVTRQPKAVMKKRSRRQLEELDYEEHTDDYSSSLSDSVRTKRARMTPVGFEIPYTAHRESFDYTESSAANTPMRRDSVTYSPHEDLLSTSDPMDEPFDQDDTLKVSIFDTFDNFSSIPMDTFDTNAQPVLISSATDDFNTTLSFMDDVFSAPLY